MEELRYTNGKLRRCGYTTGSCASAAAAAAAILLLTGQAPEAVTIQLPRGKTLILEPIECAMEGNVARCAIRKFSGDDPDITDGILVYARVEKTDAGIHIDGGVGVGRVTKPGLDQPVGNAAINSGPRSQITENVCSVARKYGYTGGFRILISVPEGEELARRTFNPKLGIVGGISILGTSGIVEPMSSAALTESLRAEISVLAHGGQKNMLLVLGNYGRDFAEEALGLDCKDSIMCSNLIGDALSAAVEQQFQKVLLVGHIGKLVKLGIGQTNTHSNQGDGRMEILSACAVRAGADLETVRKILDCATTDAALDLLGPFLDRTLAILQEKINETLLRFVRSETKVEWVCFTKENGVPRVLMQSVGAEALEELWRIGK